MTKAIRRPLPASTLAFAALTLVLLALSASPAQGAVGYVRESFTTFEEQLAAGQIHEAVINKRIRTVRLTLTNGQHMLAKYQPHEEPLVRAKLRHKHVHVTVLTEAQAKKEAGKRPIHHKIRYIVGGVALALLVIGGGAFLIRRRREASELS